VKSRSKKDLFIKLFYTHLLKKLKSKLKKIGAYFSLVILLAIIIASNFLLPNTAKASGNVYDFNKVVLRAGSNGFKRSRALDEFKFYKSRPRQRARQRVLCQK